MPPSASASAAAVSASSFLLVDGLIDCLVDGFCQSGQMDLMLSGVALVSCGFHCFERLSLPLMNVTLRYWLFEQYFTAYSFSEVWPQPNGAECNDGM